MIHWNVLFSAFLTLNAAFVYPSEPVVHIHYLGHSSFVLQFDNGTSVLTDYGKSKAYYEIDPVKWNSPIYGIGELKPDIVTYSHVHHEDHYIEEREPKDAPMILKAADSTNTTNGVQIDSIRTSENYENGTGDSNNRSYLFSYKGIKILHLGDVQGDIIHIDNEEVKDHISKLFPDRVDVLLMPVEGTTRFEAQAVVFLDLVRPKRVILMHYWTEAYRDDFIDYIEKNSTQDLDVRRQEAAQYSLFDSNAGSSTVEVIGLEPGVFLLTAPLPEDGERGFLR